MRKWLAVSWILMLLGIICVMQDAKAQNKLLLLYVGSSSGAISLKSQNATQNAGASQTQATTLNGTTAGNFIIVGVFWCEGDCNGTAGDTVTSVTANETCTEVSGAISNFTHIGSDIWYCPNIAGGNDTITATISGSIAKFVCVAVSQWSGINNSSPLDGSLANQNNTAANTTLSVTTNGSTTQSNELIYSVIGAGSGGITSTSQTAINTISSQIVDEYQTATTLASYSNSGSLGTTSVIAGSIAAFKHP